MDYVICQSIRYYGPLLSKLKLVFLYYDVICSWSVKFPERAEHSAQSLGQFIPDGLEIRRGIGQWHIHGHQRECLVRYGFPFMEGGGGIEGEVIELLWSFTNGISSAARAMSTWHRMEIFNDGMNHWNYKKLIGAGMSHMHSS